MYILDSYMYKDYIILVTCDFSFCLFAAAKMMQFQPSPQVPALQYIGNVDPGGAAAEAGLCTGDFLLEVRRITFSTTYMIVHVHVTSTEPVTPCVSNTGILLYMCMHYSIMHKHR